MQFKRRLVGRQVYLLSMFLHGFTWQRRLADTKSCLSALLYIKQINIIMKYLQLYTNASKKKIDDYRL